MKRKIIKIDSELCNGCGNCIPNCPEGAIQLIDGKARLVSDLFCDGLGACLGECPLGAITIVEREAEPYDEFKVMENIVKCGDKTIIAHIKHLKVHNETKYLNEALNFLKEKNIKVDYETVEKSEPLKCGCSSSLEKEIHRCNDPNSSDILIKSSLKNWPVQLHLVNPAAQYFTDADVLIAADCTAYAYGAFHNDFVKNKVLIIACPKLDSNKESYVEKIASLIDDSKIKSLSAVIMQVPCCSGLLMIIREALKLSQRKIPVSYSVISIEGDIIKKETI